MMRSLFAAVAGLRAHQQRMDVIGNNIANVNTPGFKRSRVTFQDMLNQTIRGASSPVDGGRGGTNPMQVGLGVSTGSIDTIMTGGSPQDTGKNTDLAIDGEGFFVVSDGSRPYFTRAGAFDFDRDGNLVNPNGLHVLGWKAKDGVITPDPNSTEPIKIDFSTTAPAKATEKIYFSGNLDANSASQTVTQAVYDSQGYKHTAEFTFTKTNPNTWSVSCKVDGTDVTSTLDNNNDVTPTLTFDNNGKLSSTPTFTLTNDINVVVNLTQYASETTASASQDGYPAGSLESVSFDTTGTLSGVFSNGITRPLAQVALATFSNPAGLFNEGNTLFSVSSNSGDARVDAAGKGGRGTIKPSSLEMSNVDLAQEFTDMITTQRGFQANSRVITASDEMLQDLVNLKR